MERQNWLEPTIELAQHVGFSGATSTKHLAWFRNTKMKSAALGLNTSPVEVTNISRHGFWLLLENEELFLPFSDFLGFLWNVAVGKIS
jgi:hypothetical protein